MNKLPRLIPIWLWITTIIIIILLCSSCRGGRSLGSGSAGTVILPQTPQEINRSDRSGRSDRLEAPDFQPLAPIPIVPHRQSTPLKPIYDGPDVEILNESVAPKSIIEETKTKLKPLSKAPTNLIAGDGGGVIITPQPENRPTDNKATDPIIKLDPRESDGTFNPKEKERFDWGELLLNYLLFILGAIFIWTIYDIIKGEVTAPKKKKASKRKPAKKRTRKKKAPNKKLEDYKKTIPKGAFFKNNEKPK